jgi:hypothetical protein
VNSGWCSVVAESFVKLRSVRVRRSASLCEGRLVALPLRQQNRLVFKIGPDRTERVMGLS